jgi:hypothetical protein
VASFYVSTCTRFLAKRRDHAINSLSITISNFSQDGRKGFGTNLFALTSRSSRLLHKMCDRILRGLPVGAMGRAQCILTVPMKPLRRLRLTASCGLALCVCLRFATKGFAQFCLLGTSGIVSELSI